MHGEISVREVSELFTRRDLDGSIPRQSWELLAIEIQLCVCVWIGGPWCMHEAKWVEVD